MQTHDLSYFLAKTFFDADGSQNMFVYQPALNVIDFKQKNFCLEIK